MVERMTGHIHTGPLDILVYGLSAIVVIHLLRLSAAYLADRPSTASAGKVLGAFALAD